VDLLLETVVAILMMERAVAGFVIVGRTLYVLEADASGGYQSTEAIMGE
jgi:hypothetical protein